MAGQPSSSSPQIQVGSRVGPYKILREIGQGGFGTVFLALQEQPLRRQVALKLIKPGMASRQILARFDAERQALAIMNHPNIARIYDASTADNGQPYFVMEWVPGMPITAFCDRHRLSLATRLDLFISVCQAIQHAHQKGIVHRDIKPSNILVATDDDERAVPKVIDFGLAKAIDYQVTEESLATEIGQVAGTLEYMSPEQASLSNTDVDTRSDVYSLGVLLYELLTGKIVKINRQTLGDEHPETLSSLKNLAAVYLLLGRVEEAAPLLAQSLEARRRLLGEDHPDTLRSMVGVASVYQDQGKYAESEQLYQQALEIQVRTLGETHADVHITRNNLAMLYQWQGRYDLATPLFRQALASVEESLGKDHPHTLAGKYNLAEVLMTQGALDEALPIYLETRADQQRVLGQQHPYAMVTSNRLAELYYRRGEFERAEEVLREVLAIYRAQQAGDNPPPVTGLSRAVMRLATCLVPLNQAEEAESLAREAVQLLSQAMPDNWRLHEARSALGEVHLAQHNVAAAEPLLLDSWQRLDQQREDIKPTERLPILRDALRRLVKLFEDTRQPEQVQRWQQELEQLDAQTTSPQPEQARPGPVAAP